MYYLFLHIILHIFGTVIGGTDPNVLPPSDVLNKVGRAKFKPLNLIEVNFKLSYGNGGFLKITFPKQNWKDHGEKKRLRSWFDYVIIE